MKIFQLKDVSQIAEFLKYKGKNFAEINNRFFRVWEETESRFPYRTFWYIRDWDSLSDTEIVCNKQSKKQEAYNKFIAVLKTLPFLVYEDVDIEKKVIIEDKEYLPRYAKKLVYYSVFETYRGEFYIRLGNKSEHEIICIILRYLPKKSMETINSFLLDKNSEFMKIVKACKIAFKSNNQIYDHTSVFIQFSWDMYLSMEENLNILSMTLEKAHCVQPYYRIKEVRDFLQGKEQNETS